jgi:uroporphyrinogen-III synthase
MAQFWITRAEPGAGATADRLSALGHASLIAPLIQIIPLSVTIDLSGVQAIAFTSANAVPLFAARGMGLGLPAFCVGDATARAAATAGFTTISSANGDGQDLARLIETTLSPAHGAVLHATGETVAFDLQRALDMKGFTVHTANLYRAMPLGALPATATAAFPPTGSLDGILFHSPLTVRTFASLLPESLSPRLRWIDAYCLSPAVARPLAHLPWRHIAVAERPTETALFLHIRHRATANA